GERLQPGDIRRADLALRHHFRQDSRRNDRLAGAGRKYPDLRRSGWCQPLAAAAACAGAGGHHLMSTGWGVRRGAAWQFQQPARRQPDIAVSDLPAVLPGWYLLLSQESASAARYPLASLAAALRRGPDAQCLLRR